VRSVSLLTGKLLPRASAAGKYDMRGFHSGVAEGSIHLACDVVLTCMT